MYLENNTSNDFFFFSNDFLVKSLYVWLRNGQRDPLRQIPNIYIYI